MYTISGFRVINYTNKENRKIDGIEFHLINEEAHDEKFIGKEVMQQFISRDKIIGEPSVGALCEFSYSVVRGQARITGIKIS